VTSADAFTRADLLKAWITGEMPFHWGSNNAKKDGSAYQPTAYRMAEGGADEQGSLSFSQLVYPKRFGPSACKVHTDGNLNIYNPADQVKLFVAHSAAKSTSPQISNCPGGMNRAFVANNLGKGYELQASGSKHLKDLVGIKSKPALGTQDDAYEKLAKAIYFYNSGTWVTQYSWPYMLKYFSYKKDSIKNEIVNDETICHSCRYSIEVREKVFGENLRTYIWAGERGVDLDGDGILGDNPATTEDESPELTAPVWCFAYGEKEWVDGDIFEDIEKAARGDALAIPPVSPIGRVDCVTGEELP